MQQLKRQVSALEPPECSQDIQATMVSMMDDTIDAYLLFMADEPDRKVNEKFEDAIRKTKILTLNIRKLNNGEAPYNK
jgi:hypothetical protein